MPGTIRTSWCRPQGRRRRIGRSAAAIATLASSTAGAAEQSAPALHQMVLDAHRDLAQHEIAFLALAAGAVLFAIVTAIVLVRTRRRAARLLASVRDETAALREEADRAKALLLSEPQVVIDWPAASNEPSIEGDPAALGLPGEQELLVLDRWLDPGKAAAMARAVKALRARGEPFSMALSTLAGHPIEAQGRAVGGHVVLRLKDAGGIKRELVELLERYENLAAEAVALRAVVETLPSPVWTRNAAGRLTFVNNAYARAVEAKSAAEAVDRRLELLDQA
ncbi:MAG: two-component sensor histidine kinase, partial [Xanthobacteraceae bacterium]